MGVFKALRRIMYKKSRRMLRKLRREKKKILFTGSTLLVALMCAMGVSGESGALIRKENEFRMVTGNGMNNAAEEETPETEELYAGLMGIFGTAEKIEQYSMAASERNMAAEHEEILVGASRVKKREVIRQTLEEGARAAQIVGAGTRQFVRDNQMPYSEYQTLLQIVEAEATGEDQMGKLLIANVILNRVKDPRFPDTIEGVVWQEIGGSAQFQPTIDGRIYSVEITQDTIEAVDRAIAGEDYSKGALYFMARMASEDNSVGWFENNLMWLFEHGGHEYYTLSDEVRVS